MNLANRIKKRMSELGLTQEAVANRADISQGMVYKLISGKSKSTSKIVQLAQALECDVEWLATGATTKVSSKIQEDVSAYHMSKTRHIKDLKQQIKALPVRDQKSLAMELLTELLKQA